jgi:hypothetical protein
VHGAIRSHSEGGAQRLGDAIRADRGDHDLRFARVLDPQGLFERVGVVAVDLELDAVVLDPGAVGSDVQAGVLVGHLLEADHDLHGERASEGQRKRPPGRWAPGGSKRAEPYPTARSISSRRASEK